MLDVFLLISSVLYAFVGAAWGFTAEAAHNRRAEPRLLLEAALWPAYATARLFLLLTRPVEG